jgi:hypothetical protein
VGGVRTRWGYTRRGRRSLCRISGDMSESDQMDFFNEHCA